MKVGVAHVQVYKESAKYRVEYLRAGENPWTVAKIRIFFLSPENPLG